MLNHRGFNPVRHPVLMLIILAFDSEISLNVISVLATNPPFYPIRSSILDCLSQSTVIGGSYLNFPTIAVNIVKLQSRYQSFKVFSSLVFSKFFIITKCAINDISSYDKNCSNMCIIPYLKKKQNLNLILRSISLKNIIFRIFPLKLLIIKI